MTIPSDANGDQPNPYGSPELELVHLRAKLKRLPPFLTGLIGLAVGAGFPGVICALFVVSLVLHNPGTPPAQR